MWRSIQRWLLGGGISQKGLINTLNSTWSPVILVILSVVSVVARYIENPVNCWCPAEFRPSMVTYTNNYCWLSHSLYKPMFEDYIPRYSEHYDFAEENPSFNRWIPLILILQALLFKIPGILMYFGENKLGFKRNKIRGLTEGYNNLSLEERGIVGKQMARYLDQWLKNRLLAGLPLGLLTFVIVIVYILYLLNVTSQIFLIDQYIKDPNVTTYGTHLVHNLFTNRTTEWIGSPVFPTLFMCDFSIKKIHNIQTYTVQCISNINYVYEQIFAFLWIWLVFVAIVTCCSFMLKIVEVILPFLRTRYVRQYLQSGDVTIHSDNDVSRFANNVLGEDGVVVLKGIGEVSSEFLVRDVVVNLWSLNIGQRVMPRLETRPPIELGQTVQNNPSHRAAGLPRYNQVPNVGPVGGQKEETFPLVQYAHKEVC